MSEESKTCETPRPDLATKAKAHYQELSDQACHFVPLIPEAIDAWLREPELKAELEAVRVRLLYNIGLGDRKQTVVEMLDRLLEERRALMWGRRVTSSCWEYNGKAYYFPRNPCIG